MFDADNITFEPVKGMNVTYLLAGGRLFKKDAKGEWRELPPDQWPVYSWKESDGA